MEVTLRYNDETDELRVETRRPNPEHPEEVILGRTLWPGRQLRQMYSFDVREHAIHADVLRHTQVDLASRYTIAAALLVD